jgi:hypothetical protein
MAGTFLDMYTRITTELRRSNAVTDVKQAINDAIFEAAQERFYFNETTDTSFNTVNGQEFYPDLGLVELDAIWYFNGTSRYNLKLVNNNILDDAAEGNVLGGQLMYLSHTAGQFRLYPIPTLVTAVHVSGYGKLTPYPLVNDADTNAWMVDGELFIRALAKRNFFRDVVRDYGEARVYDTIAEDYKEILAQRTAIKSSTGTIRSTQF